MKNDEKLQAAARNLLPKLVEEIQTAGRGGTYNEGIETCFLLLSHLSRALDMEAVQTLYTDLITRLNKQRPFMFDPNHCEGCEEAAEIADYVAQKVGRYSNRALVTGLARVIRVVIDSAGVDDLDGDLDEAVMDILHPEDEDGPRLN